jgi:hypothetical protein
MVGEVVMQNTLRVVDIEHALGVLGLVLVLAVTWLANRGYGEHEAAASGLGAFAARRAIDGIAVLGWLIDRLPRPATNGGM